MNKINLIYKCEKNENNNGFTLYVFEVNQRQNILDYLVEVEPLLRSEISYLKPLFIMKELDLSEIKCIENIYDYLEGFSDSGEWGKDRNDFKACLLEFKKITQNIPKKEVYILNKDLFSKEDKSIRYEEYISYGYYIIICWVYSNKFYLCEFIND